jgi:drug/metabolite transporter (DMT)-like permease
VSVPISYLTVIIIWSTTPLAIQWSGHEQGYEFGVAVRMAIGLVALLGLLRLMNVPFPWHRKARRVYLISGLSLFTAMSFVYWGAQQIPSGWISVIFGLSPIITSVMAHFILKDSQLSIMRLAGMLLGFLGLLAVFVESISISSLAMLGMLATLIAASAQSLGAVLIKQQKPDMHAMAITAGSIVVALPLFMANLTFHIMTSGGLSGEISAKTLVAIVYLGLVGSALGFPLYFYLLKQLAPERVAIITLITPVTALLLGHLLNGEYISDQVWLGTGLIILGLSVYEYGKYLPHVRKWRIRWLQRPL